MGMAARRSQCPAFPQTKNRHPNGWWLTHPTINGLTFAGKCYLPASNPSMRTTCLCNFEGLVNADPEEPLSKGSLSILPPLFGNVVANV